MIAVRADCISAGAWFDSGRIMTVTPCGPQWLCQYTNVRQYAAASPERMRSGRPIAAWGRGTRRPARRRRPSRATPSSFDHLDHVLGDHDAPAQCGGLSHVADDLGALGDKFSRELVWESLHSKVVKVRSARAQMSLARRRIEHADGLVGLDHGPAV